LRKYDHKFFWLWKTFKIYWIWKVWTN
jgi:hypothetical protein